jgi:hypothetical protein
MMMSTPMQAKIVTPPQATPCMSTPEPRATIIANGSAALASLDLLSPADPETNRKMGEVMRRLVAMRDELIAAQRAGLPCRSQLQRINSIFSSIFGMEFPSEGLQWQRVCDTREALRSLIREVGYEQPKSP